MYLGFPYTEAAPYLWIVLVTMHWTFFPLGTSFWRWEDQNCTWPSKCGKTINVFVFIMMSSVFFFIPFLIFLTICFSYCCWTLSWQYHGTIYNILNVSFLSGNGLSKYNMLSQNCFSLYVLLYIYPCVSFLTHIWYLRIDRNILHSTKVN